jgi:hypothetical protein
MANSKYKLADILDLINEALGHVHKYLAIYNFLDKHSLSNQFMAAPNFFETSKKAALREALLGISRLTLDDRESISFKMLLDTIENHPQIFTKACKCSRSELRNLIEINRAILASEDPFLKALRSVRDRELAHLDRKQINAPHSVIPIPIPIQDISHCTDVLSVIMAEIWQAFYGVAHPGYEEDAMILKELETLWMIIENYSEKVGQSE